MSTRKLVPVLVVGAALVLGVIAVRSRRQATTVTTGSDAAVADGDASTASLPYLPARSAPDEYAPPSAVEPELFRLRPGLNLCYRVAAHDHPDLVAKAIFAVTIGGEGHVTGVNLVSSETQLDDSLVDCVKRVFAQGEFPPTPDGGLETVAVPISFRPPKGGWKDGGP